MATFNYKAFDSKGKEKTGVIDSASTRAARQALREKGLIVAHIEYARESKPRKILVFKKPISTLELSLITRQFAILLNSGLSVEQALNALIDQLEQTEQKSIMMEVRAEVLAGKPLASAMRSFPRVFPAVYCSLIHAGEQSGSLASVMTKLAEYSDRTRELTNKIMMALLYPIVVTLVAIVMIVGLLVYVVPQVVKVFESSHQELPLLTRALIMVSNTVRSYGIFIVIGLVLGIFTFFHLLKNPEFKRKIHQRLLKLPVVGRLLMNIDVARFAHTLALLLSSRVPMLAALQAGLDTVNNYLLKDAISKALKLVKEGVPLAVALSNQRAFPPVVIHLIASGEKSGNLDELLNQAASHQELELSHRSQVLTGILEPALILFMGLVVLLIVIAIMLPILDMNKMVM